MLNLIKQEQFELEVLDKLNSAKILNNLVFIGGTMLRLCYGLERFSTDLDFWLIDEVKTAVLYGKIKDYLAQYYKISDTKDKFYTMLYEVKSEKYPRSLKIEIRKNLIKAKTEKSIAYSKYSNLQVLVKTPPLNDVMDSKIETFLSRNEIRDVFDIEFLYKKGAKMSVSKEVLKELLAKIDALPLNDYKVKLGSLLEQELRSYYTKEKFKILKSAIQAQITTNPL
ncbi:MAG: hypothetical protein A3J83_03675 [Elusimicrobia bacterium RIFOXYA2_FULL_40_6]|nr:MAG: hypothetical protein A3J83_03675 [Elusimicrobia bacterium RIFOXYA2_FULL_40_6]